MLARIKSLRFFAYIAVPSCARANFVRGPHMFMGRNGEILTVWAPVFSFSRDFPGILIVLILKTGGMGKWYSWDFDCLICVGGI